MGDQEHRETDCHQSTDGDQPEGAFATCGGQLNALAVFDDGGGDSICMLHLVTGCGLCIINIAVGVSDHEEAVVGLTNSNYRCSGQLVITIGSHCFLQVVVTGFQWL